MKRLNILVLAYAVSPIRGSEYSVAWNHINNISIFSNVHLFFGMAGDHMGDNTELTPDIVNKCASRIYFNFVETPKISKAINFFNRINVLPYAFYIAYFFWHLKVFFRVRSYLLRNDIDIIHFLSPIGYREPGFLWLLNKPYVWGPLGGLENRSLSLAYQKNAITGLKVLLKNSINLVTLHTSVRVRLAISRSKIVLSSTSNTSKILSYLYNKASIHIPENGIASDKIMQSSKYQPSIPLRLVWIGRLNERKSLCILLNALKRIPTHLWRLEVVGNGPLFNKYSEEVKFDKSLSSVNMTGSVPRVEVSKILNASHLHVVSSLYEGNPTTVWEAAEFGIPTIGFAIFGMKDTIVQPWGIPVVPLTNNYDAYVDALSLSIYECINNLNLLVNANSYIDLFFNKHSLEAKRRTWKEIYESIL
jgi:glycosyltransferase involved in cell wall biosynthesis